MALVSQIVRDLRTLQLDVENANGIDMMGGFSKIKQENTKYRIIKSTRRELQPGDRDFIRIVVQSRRPVVRANNAASNRPEIPQWIFAAVDGLMMISIAVVIASIFIALTEISIGRAIASAPSLIAIATFSIVGAASFKVKRSLRYFRKGNLSV